MCLALLALAPQVRGQQRVYVDADASGADDGTSWEDAFVHLQDALSFARYRAGSEEVWVAEGTYQPSSGTDRGAAFVLPADVAVYGGFAGTESGRDDRDWAAHRTVLSGDIGAAGVRADNSVHVVVVTGSEGPVTRTTVLDGFTVTMGYADGVGAAVDPWAGAGLYVSGASPTLRHLLVAGNEAAASTGTGGGLYLGFASPGPLLDDVAFIGNTAGYQGGGLYAAFGAPRLVACHFEANRASTGGGAALYEADAVIRGARFEENEAALSDGGGLHVEAGDVVVSGAVFVRNRAALSGGGVSVTSRGGHPFWLVDAAFYGNVSGASGGGIAIGGDGVTVANAIFVGNRAARGGAVDAGRSAPTLVGLTTTANEAPSGAGVFMSGGLAANAVFWGNLGPEVEGYGAPDPPPDVRHAVVEGGLPSGAGVVVEDPRFSRTPHPGTDGVWGTGDDDYGDLRPALDGPAVDAGLDLLLPPDRADLDGDGDRAEPLPLDLEGGSRVQGRAVDLGPYESAAATAAEPGAAPAAPALSLEGPNPFRDRASLTLHLEHESTVDVAAYDALGRRVATLHRGRLTRGVHRLSLEGAGLSPGFYAVRASLPTSSAVRWLTRVP